MWRSPDYTGGPLNRILVVGVAKEDLSRRIYEDGLAAALSGDGTTAVSSYRQVPGTGRPSEARLKSAVRAGGFDGLLVTRLRKVDSQTTYVPPRTYTVPRHYVTCYGYITTAYDVVHHPGYLRQDTIVQLETNLYDARTDQLLWSGRSDTMNPKSVQDAIDSVARALASELRKAGMVGA